IRPRLCRAPQSRPPPPCHDIPRRVRRLRPANPPPLCAREFYCSQTWFVRPQHQTLGVFYFLQPCFPPVKCQPIIRVLLILSKRRANKSFLTGNAIGGHPARVLVLEL